MATIICSSIPSFLRPIDATCFFVDAMYAYPTLNAIASGVLGHVVDVPVFLATCAELVTHKKFANQKAPTDNTAIT